MDTPKTPNKQVKDKTSSSVGGEEERNTVATGTDGTDEQQLDVMPAANSFLELVPQVAGGGDMIVSTSGSSW